MRTTEAAARATAWLKTGARPVRVPLIASIALGLFSGLLILLQTAILVEIVNSVIFGHLRLSALTAQLSGLLAVIVIRSLTQYASRRTGYACASRVKVDTRKSLIRKLRTIGPVGLAAEHGGELANTIIDGVESLEGYYARYLPQRAVASLLPLAILAVAYPLDWISGVIFSVTALFIPVLMVLIGEEARQRNQKQWNQLSRMSARFLDIISGIGTVKMFGASRREAAVIARISEQHRESTMNVVKVAFVSSLMLELITTVSIALVAITTGFRLLGGEMPFYHAYFILLIAPEFYFPLRTMGIHYHSRMAAAAAAERIVELLGTDAPADRVDTTGVAHRVGIERGAGISLELADVHFSYPSPDRAAALSGLSLTIGAGERVALFGRSGAGKSTLLSLLMRFAEPNAGKILANGKELSGIDPRHWRNLVSWMPQRPTLFFGDIRDNIRMGRPDASEEEVQDAAYRARADEFIRRLPDGYHSRVGEQGWGLSGGELQRIALARLFLRNSPLILLDEPGSHLDPDTEALLFDGIEELSRGKTLIVVAHRPTAVRLVERIAVMIDGRIAESGDHRMLRAANGEYARMMESFGVAL